MCEKVSDELKYDIYTKKYDFAGDYIALNEFLAILNCESRNIATTRVSARVTAAAREAPRVSFNNTNDSRDILKKESWRVTSPTPATMA